MGVPARRTAEGRMCTNRIRRMYCAPWLSMTRFDKKSETEMNAAHATLTTRGFCLLSLPNVVCCFYALMLSVLVVGCATNGSTTSQTRTKPPQTQMKRSPLEQIKLREQLESYFITDVMLSSTSRKTDVGWTTATTYISAGQAQYTIVRNYDANGELIDKKTIK